MINIQNLSKTFTIHKKKPGLIGSLSSLFHREWHRKEALLKVTLNIEQGELVGLLGANGAGKTTLVKVCTGIIRPSEGTVKVLGYDPWHRKNEYRKQISLIMGQKAQLWWDLPAADCLILLKEIYQISQKDFDDRVHHLTEILDVKDLMTTQIRRLSLGERMKMELVAALLHQPKVVFLDEPTIGLDISSQRALREFILHYHREFQPTIVLTSHYMEDIEKLCRRIIILRDGGVVYDGGLRELIQKHAQHKFLTLVLDESASTNNNNELISDLGRSLPANWGEVLSTSRNELKLKVNRDKVSSVSSVVLSKFNVIDLNVSDVDVGTIVSNIQKH